MCRFKEDDYVKIRDTDPPLMSLNDKAIRKEPGMLHKRGHIKKLIHWTNGECQAEVHFDDGEIFPCAAQKMLELVPETGAW